MITFLYVLTLVALGVLLVVTVVPGVGRPTRRYRRAAQEEGAAAAAVVRSLYVNRLLLEARAASQVSLDDADIRAVFKSGEVVFENSGGLYAAVPWHMLWALSVTAMATQSSDPAEEGMSEQVNLPVVRDRDLPVLEIRVAAVTEQLRRAGADHRVEIMEADEAVDITEAESAIDITQSDANASRWARG